MSEKSKFHNDQHHNDAGATSPGRGRVTMAVVLGALILALIYVTKVAGFLPHSHALSEVNVHDHIDARQLQEHRIDLQLDVDVEQDIDLAVETEVETVSDVFIVVEKMPVLIGGISALASEIQYPKVARKAGIQGKVFVQFIVDKDGLVHNPVVVRGIGGGCDEEALRALKTVRFEPGLQRGQPVAVKMSLPVVFRLSHAEGRVSQ